MKRSAALLSAISITAALALTACGPFAQNGTGNGTATEQPRGSEVVETQPIKGTLTLLEHLTTSNADAIKLIEAGEIPAKLSYFAANSADGDITNAETISDILSMLLAVQVDFSQVQDVSIDDGGVIFTFTWEDGTELYLSFLTSEYYESGRELFTVVDASKVSNAMNTAYYAILDELNTEEVDTIGAFTDGSVITWDGDGDDELEVYYVEHIDNGDEAPSVIEISLATDSEIGVIINGAYDLLDVEDVALEDGNAALRIKYTAGDYYSHNRKETVLVTRAYSEDGDFTVVDEDSEDSMVVLDGNGLA